MEFLNILCQVKDRGKERERAREGERDTQKVRERRSERDTQRVRQRERERSKRCALKKQSLYLKQPISSGFVYMTEMLRGCLTKVCLICSLKTVLQEPYFFFNYFLAVKMLQSENRLDVFLNVSPFIMF